MTDHIQINDVAPRIQYLGDGAQTDFAYPFAIFTSTDLCLWLDGVAQTSGYTVSGAGDSSGGTVAFDTAPAADTVVTLARTLTLARTSDFQADGIIRAKTINDELDYQVAALQQIAEITDRAITRPVTSTSTADLSLPDPVASRALKWNDDGTALTNSDYDPDSTGDILTAAETALAAATQAVTAATQAQAAVGGVRISADDSTAAPLADKLVAGDGITVTTATGESGAQTLVLATNSMELDSRIAFLETNLALNTLRDQIDAGWSVLNMVGGIADEFEDQSGISSSSGATYNSSSDYYSNLSGTSVRFATATATAPLGGTAAYFNDNSTSTIFTSSALGDKSSASTAARIVAQLDLGSVRTILSAELINTYQASGASTTSGSPGIYTSLDGSTWTLYGDIIQTTTTPASFTRTSSVSTRYVAYVVSAEAWGSYYPLITDFNVYIPASPDNMVLTSVSATAETEANEARVVLLHQPVDTVTLNTDCTIEASRDGGTTWTAGTLANQGAFDASTNILTATVDLSAQPAGTAMRWRFSTFNTTEQRLHGVWLQWSDN